MKGVPKGEVAVLLTEQQAALAEAMLIEIIKRRMFPGIRNRSLISMLLRVQMATASAKMDSDKP